ncbi:MAG: DUF1801 domain-containing protein [Flavobacteriaceae bacterium]|nr:DUF1801 domain-containing protein [Flavobacteriaceae bacterium]
MNKIDQYISKFPEEVQQQLQKVRAIIKTIAPEAIEQLAYGMPGYKTNGKPLVYFAGYKNHIGFYATPSGHKAFQKQMSIYKQGKGSVQFPLNQPIPFDLIEKIVRFRVDQNSASK